MIAFCYYNSSICRRQRIARQHQPGPWQRLLSATAAVLLHACAPSGDGPPPSIQRDSAGITIVESLRPAWGDPAQTEVANSNAWRIDPQPILDLSESGTGDAHSFYHVRGMARLPDGSVVVLNAGSDEIRQFSADGGFVGSFGGPGQGQGPGEFTNAQQLEVAGDKILVVDRDGVISVFGPGPVLIRETRLARRTLAVHALGNGRLVARVVPPIPELGRLTRVPEVLRTYRLDGSGGDSIGWTPGYEDYVVGDMRIVPLFQKKAVVGTHGSRIFTGSSDRMRVEEMTASGDTVRILRLAGFDLAVSEAEAVTERDARLEAPTPQGRPMPPRLQQLLEDMPLPTTRPAYADMIVDPAGAIWLRPFRGMSEGGGPESWLVLDPGGRWLGRVEVPEDFHVWDIGIDEVLGVWHDELDVQHPQVLRLQRNGE